MKNKSNLDLRKRFPSPAASPSLRRAFPLMVGGSIPLSELGGHSFQPGVVLVFFEHRLKHDLKDPSYAMPSIPKESCRDDKKRALSCIALKKKDLR